MKTHLPEMNLPQRAKYREKVQCGYLNHFVSQSELCCKSLAQAVSSFSVCTYLWMLYIIVYIISLSLAHTFLFCVCVCSV